MKWVNPPHGGNYKLVATKKYKNDIGLIVLCETEQGLQRRTYGWNAVPWLPNSDLKSYLLSLKEGIESGIYDIALLDKELDENNPSI